MTPFTRGRVFNWGFATVIGDALPPRDPDDDETEDEEDDEQDEDLDPAVIREPDEQLSHLESWGEGSDIV